MNQDSVVPNSEASDEEIVIPLHSEPNVFPIFDDEYQVRVIPGSLDNVAQTPPDIGVYSNSIRRALRKRKAIQKMPYSLDRIRHRQLLQGYDVSNFESLADHINLPSGSRQDITVNTDNGGVLNSSPVKGGLSQQEDSTIASTRLRRHHHFHISDDDDDDEVYGNAELDSDEIRDECHSESDSNQFDRSSLSYDDNVVFRGRQVNIRTGYKGVLPKMAWKKALDNNTVESNRQGRNKNNHYDENSRSKGLAKRKISRRTFNSRDDNLVNELIESDAEIEVGFPETYLRLQNEQDSMEDSKLEEYFLQKYEPEPDSDSDSNPPSSADDITEITSQGIELLTLDDDEKTALETIIFEPSSIEPSSAIAKDSTSEIDFMLTKTQKNRRSLDSKPTILKDKSKRTGIQRHGKKRARNITGSRGRERISMMNKVSPFRKVNSNKATRENSSKNSYREPFSMLGYPKVGKTGDKPDVKETRQENSKAVNRDKNTKKIKNGMKLFTIAPTPNAELNRKAMTFSTVVEELSDKFAVRPIAHIGRYKSTLPSNPNLEVKKPTTILNHSLLEALNKSLTFDSPNVIKLTLNGDNFIVSKFNQNAEETLREMLDSVVKFGGPDYEVNSLAKSLAEFLFSWTSTEVYDIIERFHHEFRAKVNSLRERAKPIHFFFIAVCQLLFLEISRYFSTSISVRNQIPEKITDHIISFFKLYSKCEIINLYRNNDTMTEAISLLRFVIEYLKCEEMLWQKLRRNKFSPAVAGVIAMTFRTNKQCWSMVKVNQTYQDAVSWIKFIGICSNEPYEWEITNDLALDLYAFFKARKFEDFEEESRYQNFPVVPHLEDELRETLFNTFINILESCRFSTSTLEKLTPMSKIHDLNSPSLFVNRLNLLLTLAYQSTYSYERHFEELLEQYVLNLDLDVHQVIIKAMLEGSLSFFSISHEKKHTVKGKWVPMLWKKVSIYKLNSINKVWRSFWKNLKDILPHLSKSRVAILRSFQSILHNMLLSDKKLNQATQLLDIYVESLEILNTDWIQTHVLQLLVSKAKENVTYLHYYCKIAKYLTCKNALTWWSLFHYNTFEDNESISVTYYTFLAQECDASTFSQMKLTVYQKILARLIKQTDPSLINLINVMASRDSKLQIKIRQTTMNENVNIMKQFLLALYSAGYTTLFHAFLNDLKDVYFQDSAEYEFIKDIVLFLNYKMIDTVRLYPVFIHLRSVFHINDEETENSALREYLRGLPSDNDRLLYLVERVLSTLENNMNITSLMETMKKAVKDKCFDDDIRTFSTVLSELPLKSPDIQLPPLLIVCVIFLELLNDRIESSPLRPSEARTESFIGLVYSISSNIHFCSQQLTLHEMKAPMRQYYRFFYNLLRMSLGFSQHRKIKSFLQNELSGLPNIEILRSSSVDCTFVDLNFERRFTDCLSKHSFNNFDLSAAFSSSEFLAVDIDYMTMISNEFLITT